MGVFLRLTIAALVFVVVFAAATWIGLQFMTPFDAEDWRAVATMGVLGTVIVAKYFGPLLLSTATLGLVAASVAYGYSGARR